MRKFALLVLVAAIGFSFDLLSSRAGDSFVTKPAEGKNHSLSRFAPSSQGSATLKSSHAGESHAYATPDGFFGNGPTSQKVGKSVSGKLKPATVNSISVKGSGFDHAAPTPDGFFGNGPESVKTSKDIKGTLSR